ncbi:MAG: ABC transporter permease [Ilumatobacteraceae bacterium]|jgi:putative ABC transport system permease protein|nr:ABC transporter permease [Ilumatobacteraceae bacterium]
MSVFRDLVRVAMIGLLARKVRTLLLLLGPMIGVAAIIAAVGLTDSAKGDLKAKVAELGTNLVEASASSSFGGQDPTLPEDVVERAMTVTSVRSVAPIVELSNIIVTPYEEAREKYETVPIPVVGADQDLPVVLEVPMVSGRWLNSFDESSGARSAVIGVGLAREFGVLPDELRTIDVGGFDYTVVGILDSVQLEPGFDTAVFISFASAENDFLDDDVRPNKIYARVDPSRVDETADALTTAIGLGGPDEVKTDVKSEALELAAQSDRQLQLIVVSMGLLAIIVGGLGIANVMSISVIQRSSEIGIRRALGHTRRIIAVQFLLEAVVVGVIGGVCGVLLGMLAIFVGASIAGWVFVMAPWLAPAGIVLAITISVMAGLYPARRAARLEPLETLRLG